MFVKSIRSKIVIWYTFILVLVLGFFSVLVYANLRKALYDDLNDLLELKAEGVAGSIETYWEIEKQEGLRQGAAAEVFSKVNNLNFIRIAQRWVKEKSTDPELLGIIVNIFGPKGEKIASSGNDHGAGDMREENLRAVLRGSSRFENRVSGQSASGHPELMRVFTMPVVENNRLAYVVQVASPTASFQGTLSKLRFYFFMLLPLAVFLSAAAGFFLADMIIKPINRIVGTVRRITAESLKLRINIPDTKDEISRLADTFNSMLEKLDGSFSSQRQLVQDISHELRTPLTIMRGEMEVALKKSRSPEEYKEVLESGLEEIGRLSLIVENLLILSRFDSKEVNLEMKPIPLADFLRGIVADMRFLADRKKIALSCCGEEGLSVAGDEHQLRRAFLNIIDNAVKYTPEGRTIRVALEKTAGGARVKISDTGIGISRENQRFIFDRFFRVDKSRSSEGFGLGLSITKSIIEAHKGGVSIESELGRGTTVIVDLPD